MPKYDKNTFKVQINPFTLLMFNNKYSAKRLLLQYKMLQDRNK